MGKKYKARVAMILLCNILLLGSLTAELGIAQEPASTGETVDRIDSRTPRGWINVTAANWIIINDTRYIITGSTRFPDGRNALKEGVFVAFDIKTENILSRIYIVEPLAEDMYMKPIARSSGSQISGGESENAAPASENKASGGMHLENGVWVN